MSSARQLAAILFTDIVGYSAMMQQDEQRPIDLVRHPQTVLQNTVTEHQGKVIEYYGDGSLCIFTSITKAMHCALRFQQQMKAEAPVPLGGDRFAPGSSPNSE